MQGSKVLLISHITMQDGDQLCIKFSVATVSNDEHWIRYWLVGAYIPVFLGGEGENCGRDDYITHVQKTGRMH